MFVLVWLFKGKRIALGAVNGRRAGSLQVRCGGHWLRARQPGIVAQRLEVRPGGIARNPTAGADDATRAGSAMTLGHAFGDDFGSAVAEQGHRIEVAQDDLPGHLLARQRLGRQRVHFRGNGRQRQAIHGLTVQMNQDSFATVHRFEDLFLRQAAKLLSWRRACQWQMSQRSLTGALVKGSVCK